MKNLTLTLTGIIMLATLAFWSCTKETSTTDARLATATTVTTPTGTNCLNYTVTLAVDKTTHPGNTIFTWTITNPSPGNGSGTTLQDLSHWDFDPRACLDSAWQDVLSAAYNSGTGWVNISPLVVEPDKSMTIFGCTTGNVFKFDKGTSGATPTQYQMILKGNWGTGDVHAYFKSGAKTGCCDKVLTNLGIGCPIKASCSFSQGYWFANNTQHPAGVHPWPATVTIGGKVYSNAEGLAIWNAADAGGITDAKKAFGQLAAIRLSKAGEAGISTASATIDCWLQSIPKLTPNNLSNQSAQSIAACGNAKAAADAISTWINANHCVE